MTSAASAERGEEERSDEVPLVVEGLRVRYGPNAAAVDGVDVSVGPGEIVGLVGESGCGKSSIAMALLGLLPESAVVTADRFDLCGRDLRNASEKEWNLVRGTLAATIFQEPMAALNPCMRVGHQIEEMMALHGIGDKRSRRDRSIELLQLVQVPDPATRARQYPHQLSGGMRQRVMIAIAMAASPQLLIADEPTTALDVTVQAQVLRLVTRLRDETGLSVLFISHDLGVVSDFCDRVLVMYAGQVVETGPPDVVLHSPQHPYTIALLRSIPGIDAVARAELPTIEGQISDRDRATRGCRFRARCTDATLGCERPQPIRSTIAGTQARCWRIEGVESPTDVAAPEHG